MKKVFILFPILVIAALSVTAGAQTFEITPPPGQDESTAQPAQQPAQSGQGIGWGSSIEVGRLARAAESALRKGNTTAAANYAQRAVQAAPNNPELWFLLGYTSRMAGRYSTSLDAYRKGLKFRPGAPDGLSGMAQTYARMGRTEEAKKLLLQVLAKNPRRVNDLMIAGELFIRSGDTQRGLGFLQRAHAVKPTAHIEVLMATAYMKMKQPAKAKELLASARRRDPKNVAIFRAVANFQRQERDYTGAIATLKAAPRQTPEILGDLGYSYELNGDKQESASAYAKAADGAPSRIGFQLSAAQAHLRLGDAEKTQTFIKRAAAIDPEHYRLHALRANIARNEKRNDEAIREYNAALSRMPEAPSEGMLYPVQLRLNLSELYKEQGNDAAARQQMALAEQQINTLQVEGPARAEFLRVRASIKASSDDLRGAEADLKEAMGLDPSNTNIHLQLANVYWKTDRRDQAKQVYAGVLKGDPKNRFALSSLGYIARDEGDGKAAEQYFIRLAEAHPDDYSGYVALGDMYTDQRKFDRAEASYLKAFKLAPKNPVIIANAANAAIEARKFELAKTWVDRASGAMNDDPRVMRERERYLFHTGSYLEAADLGYKVLQRLPKDRNASVYLAYSLYNLGRFDDVLRLVNQYDTVLPKEANFPLLAGHVHKQSQLLDDAVNDYGRALARDPKMVEAYVNRGYVYNDLQNAEQAREDFNSALKINPKHGVAHLGLAFANLQLHNSSEALDHADQAARMMGESGATHLARATAYRQQRALDRAEREYVAALKFSPNDFRLHMALANTQFNMRRYNEALGTLNAALRLSPDDPQIYAQMAHAYARLGRRNEAIQYIEAAERTGADEAAMFLSTGDALLSMGDTDAAMERFALALEAPDTDRVQARLAIARVFVRQNEWEDAKQQIALAFAESRVGEAAPLTADNFIEAANVLLAINDFDLAERYYLKAKQAGAGDEAVAVGLAHTYLAKGDDVRAEAELASLGSPQDRQFDYDYNLAMAGIHRKRRENVQALSAFGRASALGGNNDPDVERAMREVAAEEGYRVGRGFSVSSDFSMASIFENSTVYMIDAKLLGVTDPAVLPTPRSSFETRATSGYRFRWKNLPPISGFFQLRNARGEVSLPSEGIILERNTYDYNFNTGINPSLRLGPEVITFNAGVQFTARRDKDSPIRLNQNLFRKFAGFSTTSFFNWISVRGGGFHESGPYTEREGLTSRDLGANLDFTVGRPWGNTALVTGYSVRDVQLDPLIREFFTTSTYAGLRRQFGDKFTATLVGEYIRSWRVENLEFGKAQAMRPALEMQIRPNNNWVIDGTLAYTRGQGFHEYDNVESGFLISYIKPLRRTLDDGVGPVPIEYPIRFSVGMQQQSFFKFTGRDKSTFHPVFRLTFF